MEKKLMEIMEPQTYESEFQYVLYHNIGKIEYPNHWHNAIEIIMPIEGTIFVDINADTHELDETDILIVPPGSIHALKSDLEYGQRIILLFDIEVLHAVRGLINASIAYAQHQVIKLDIEPALHKYVHDLLTDMLDEHLRKDPYYEINMLCKIIDISVRLSREQLNEDLDDYDNIILRRENAAKINECINYIKTNFNNVISLDMVAGVAGFSKYHFTRWFKQYTGMTFTDYLNKIRMEKAEALLLGTTQSVLAIALETGFQSVITFNRVFKNRNNLTPTEFRKLNSKDASHSKEHFGLDDKYTLDFEKEHISIMKVPPYIKQNSYNQLPGASQKNQDGTYNNPFLWADVPDPDVIRVNDVYYMVSTTMYFTPHCPVMKSYDLVNWEIINYVCDILDDSDACTLRNGAHAYGKGTWAAGLKYHNNKFYVTVASFTSEKTYIFQTENIENGPWRRYEINHLHHDQSLLFDDDGRVYLVSGAGKIHIIELNEDATDVLPGGVDKILIDDTSAGGKGGLPAEGSHFYKINGYYYLFLIAWPPSGSGRRIQLCYRADSILGPYEGRVVLDDDLGFNNNGVAQGGIVDTPDGDWYAILFQDHGAVGRIPVLLPVTWEDDWPVFGKNGAVPKHINPPGNKKNNLPVSIVGSDEFYLQEKVKIFTAINNTEYLYSNYDVEYVLNDKRPEIEIIKNNYFINGLDNWGVNNAANLDVITDESSNKLIMKVTNRATTAAGLKQDVGGRVRPGLVYEINARVKYENGPPEKQFLISIIRDEGWESIQIMGEAHLVKGEWGNLKGTYTLPIGSRLIHPKIFIETPYNAKPRKDDDLIDYYVESVSMLEKPMIWKSKTALFENEHIDSYLSLVWQWNHNPDHNLWSLKDRPGYLRLKSGYLSTDLIDARNTLTQRTFGPVCTGTVALETYGMKDGDVAGLAALQDEYGCICIKAKNGKKYITMENASSGHPDEIETRILIKNKVYLRISFDFRNAADKAYFYYSEDEIHWYSIGDVLKMEYKLTHFTGYRFALLYYSTQIIGGHADFDYFRLSDNIDDNESTFAVLHANLGSDIEVSGIPNIKFGIPVYMDALPKDLYKGIHVSLKIPYGFEIEDVVFNKDNIVGKTGYIYSNSRLQLAVTGKEVKYRHNKSNLLAMLHFKVKNFSPFDDNSAISADYIHVDGGSVIFDTHDMNVKIKLSSISTKAKAKIPGYANPLITHKFGADPWAMVYDDRVYLYLTADVYEYNDRGKLIDNTYGKINKITVISSSDLINWTDHGEIHVAGVDGAARWASHSWAPAVAFKQIDGKDKFFLYFSNNGSNIGVLTAESPAGPWTDPLGKPMIHKDIPGVDGVVWCFDPAVLVDDDGKGYLYFGGGLPSKNIENILHPKTARVIELGEDMISTVGAAQAIDSPAHFESAGINKINGKYYYSYCANFEGKRSKKYPEHGAIAYMISDNPMGPFKYSGTILRNPEHFFGVGGNNHHCIFNFNNAWYISYHAQTLAKAVNKIKGYRSPHINTLTVANDGHIRPVIASFGDVMLSGTVNPYVQTKAVNFAWQSGINTITKPENNNSFITDIHNDDWIAVANVDFGSKGATRFSAYAASLNGGEIEVRLNDPEGVVAGILGVNATEKEDVSDIFSCEIDQVTGQHNIFFVFKGDSEGNLMNFELWWFE